MSTIETDAAAVNFEAFSRACDLVDAYFGNTIDDVALSAPVSRAQLVAVLARAHLSGRSIPLEQLQTTGTLAYRSDRETLWWLEGGFWTDLRCHHHLAPEEARAGREVHRRIIEAVDGDVPYYNRERDPLVRIEPKQSENGRSWD